MRQRSLGDGAGAGDVMWAGRHARGCGWRNGQGVGIVVWAWLPWRRGGLTCLMGGAMQYVGLCAAPFCGRGYVLVGVASARASVLTAARSS